MSNWQTDRNLLFGILALQVEKIHRVQLRKAMLQWTLNKNQTIGQILVEDNAISAEECEILEQMVSRHIQVNGGDPRKILTNLILSSSIRSDLESLHDPEIQNSLSVIPSHQLSSNSEQTIAYFGEAESSSSQSSLGIRFSIIRPHAEGGLGRVSVALDRELNREVAIKEIKAEYARDSEARQRFNLEAEITAKLEHPGVVPVYGLGHREDGQPFYAMRFIAGDSLKDACAKYHAGKKMRSSSENTLLFRELLARFIDVCNTIAYAHSRGILHRDLKPGNIMLGKYGETLVVDWGLAKSVLDRNNETEAAQQSSSTSTTGSTTATLTGSVVGTPQFMSPEQASGRLGDLGAASDIYSLGATLYYLLANNAPFAGQPASQILENVGKGFFPKPSEIDPSIPRALEAICLKAMALHPQDRYSSPQELAKDIERYLADEPTEAYRESLFGRIFRIARKISLPFAAGYLFFNSFAYCLILLVATPIYLYQSHFMRTTYSIVLVVVFSIAYMGVFGAIGFQLGYFVLKGNVKSLWLAEILYLIVTCVYISVIPRQISYGDTDDILVHILVLATSSVGLASVSFAILNRNRSIKI